MFNPKETMYSFFQITLKSPCTYYLNHLQNTKKKKKSWLCFSRPKNVKLLYQCYPVNQCKSLGKNFFIIYLIYYADKVKYKPPRTNSNI